MAELHPDLKKLLEAKPLDSEPDKGKVDWTFCPKGEVQYSLNEFGGKKKSARRRKERV